MTNRFLVNSCLAIGLGVMLAVSAPPSRSTAAETGGCDSFAWPLDIEMGWMKAADGVSAVSGTTLGAPPEKAVALTLKPMSGVSFPVAPTTRRKEDDAKQFGGIVTFASIGTPGTYQISLASRGWVDVIQNGAPLKAGAHTGKSDCDGLRKSVRFDIGAGPVTLEISGVAADAIKFAVRRAADK